MMTKKVKFLEKNRSGERLNPVGAVLHETATPGASAEDEFRFFSTGERGASAHGFVDRYGYIQTIPYTEVAWHAGPTANRKYIGIELCHAESKDEFDKIWNNAVEVFAGIFGYFGWEVSEETLPTHRDVSLKWGETDHTDPIGYFRKFGKTAEDFREDVKRKINGGLTMTQYEELSGKIEKMQSKLDRINTFEYNYMDENMPGWAKKSVQKLLDKGYLEGNGKGLALTHDMLRIITVLDRAGAFGE